MASAKILVVDDDAIQLRRLTGLLGPHYQVETSDRAAQLVDLVRRIQPDLIVLDIELPDGNGIDLCRELKALSDLQAIPVVFHSGHDTLANRIEAYEAGGSDFFLKSMLADEFLAKVAVVLEWVTRNKRLEHERAALHRTAQAHSVNLGELSVALEALREAGTATDLLSLAQLGVDALGDWGIDANAQVRAGKDAITLGRKGHATPLEVSILHNLRLVGPKFQLGSRMVLNFSHASILLRNLPVDNQVQAQRVADKASVIGEALSSRAAAIETDQLLQQRQQALFGLGEQVDAAARALDKLDQAWQVRKLTLSEVLTGLQDDLERHFLALSMSKKEEAACLAIVHQRVAQISALFEQSPAAEPALQRLREKGGRR
ncbi:PleD family two-component system response regulator [Chitinimonas sp.]|uniref:PleD family two-component system response regulator n=1 Tax=Chitinimonas sp. TaxID=1934313 RepID=UPI0035B3479A